MRTPILLLSAVLIVLGVGSSATAGTDAQSSATLVAKKSRYGTVLFDGRGFALYGFTRDRRGRPSTCYGACARAWPVFYRKTRLAAGKGVKQSLLGTTRRRDGRLQVTYNGWPLYYYIGEQRPGVILCQNVEEYGGTWLVVRPNGRLVRQ